MTIESSTEAISVLAKAINALPDSQPQMLAPELEQQLIKQAKTGNHRAFTQLLQVYDRRIMSVILRFTANHYDREDLYQEIFTACFRSLPNFNEGSAFYTWLYRIAMNHCISFMRKQRPVESEQEVAVSDKNWETSARLAAISNAQKQLNGPQRVSFHLFYIEQWSLQEIAMVLECNIGTVKSHLHRAREKVRADEEVKKWKIEI